MDQINKPSHKLRRVLNSGISLCAMFASVSFGTVAFAQTPTGEATGGTEVVVTGIKKSLAKSVAVKRANNSIVEVVTAEDIGKLPDVSIAESLARLPGVAAQRVDGRAQVLSIRGMAPKFAMTLLNGQEMVSTGDDRSFEYDQFPSELISQAIVYKTPDASLGTQGLSGTVDMRTVHPLDFHDRKINLGVRYDANSYGDIIPGSKSSGNRLSFSYIDQFADGKIGVAFGYAHLDSPNQKKYFNPWDYGTGEELGVDGASSSQYIYSGFETGIASTETVRDGYLGALQFKPNDHFNSQINLFHSTFKQRMNGRELVGVLANWAPGTDGNVPYATVSGSSAVLENMLPFLTSRKNNRDDTVDAISWTNEFDAGEWKGRADLSYSKAKRNETIGEAYAMVTDPITMTVNLPTNYKDFGSVTTSSDLGDASNFDLTGAWWWGGGYASVAVVEDELKSVRLSAKRPVAWGAFSAFEGGLIYSERSKSLDLVGTNYNLSDDYACHDGWIVCSTLPSSLLQSPVSLSFVGLPSLISFDTFEALNSSAFVKDTSDARNPAWNWSVMEKITTGFAKLDLNFTAGVPVRGNFGVQVVHADQSSDGLYVDANGDLNPASGGTSYTDVLPNLNLIAEVGDQTLIRFGVAKAVARPNMSDMRAGVTASVSESDHQWYGSGGNPNLKPWRSTDFDLSVEKYFTKGSYMAFAMFDKEIETGVVTKSIEFDFTGFKNPTAILADSVHGNIGTLTAPTNSVGGSVKGWELSGAVEGALINPALDGFGLLGSYSKTMVKAGIDPDTGEEISGLLEGWSGDVWSVTGYYEKHGFQARIAQRYRSAFSATRHNAFKFVTDTIRPELITDAQVGYTFEDGPLNGVAILLQVNNLFDTPYVVTQTYQGSTILKEHHEFGSQYMLGVSYKF